jgi:hypothetical protein
VMTDLFSWRSCPALFTADNLNRGIFQKRHSLTLVRE